MSAHPNVDKVVHDVEESVKGHDRPMEQIDNRSPLITIALPYFLILSIGSVLATVIYLFWTR